MSVTVKLEIENLENVRRRIKYMSQAARDAGSDIIQSVEEEALELITNEAPVGKEAGQGKYPGQLRDAVASRRLDKHSTEIYIDEAIAPYGVHVVKGTGRSHGRYVPGIGRVPGGEHPGTPPNPFVSRGMKKFRPRLKPIMLRELRRRRLWRRTRV